MFIKTVQKNFDCNTPIFSYELEKCFNNYSKTYIYRLINNAIKEKKLVYYDRGIYYLPTKTPYGLSTINSDSVIKKKYLNNEFQVYGIITGIALLNKFSITTQMPNILEIVTNSETTRKRYISVNNKKYILKRPYCLITKENYTVYTLLELFNILNDNVEINDYAKTCIYNFVKDNNITLQQILDMSLNFPAKALKRLVRSNILNGII